MVEIIGGRSEIAINEFLDKYDLEVESRQYIDIRRRVKAATENARVAEGNGIRAATFDPETLAALQRQGVVV